MISNNVIVNIVNVVSSTKIYANVVFRDIVDRIPEAEFNPAKFSGVVLRLQNPKASITVFESGQVVCAGAKSVCQSVASIRKAIKKLQDHHVLTKPPQLEISVQNIVASINLQGRVDLENTAITISGCIYEPEQFPGIIIRIRDPVIATILLFSTGKLVCTGTKTENDLFRVIDSLKIMLSEKNLISYER